MTLAAAVGTICRFGRHRPSAAASTTERFTLSQYPPEYPPPCPPPPPSTPQQQPPQPGLSFDYYRPAGGGGPLPAGDPGDLLAPARRASTLMFVLGGLALLAAGCTGMMAAANPFEQMPPEQLEAVRRAEAQLKMSARTMMAVSAGVMLVGAGGYLAMAAWVRRGGSSAVITALVVTALVTFLMAVNTLSGVAQAGAGPEMAMSACVLLLATGACGLLLYWLFQAAKAAKAVDAARQQFAAQFWQSRQQQAAYGQVPNPSGPYAVPGAVYPPMQQQQATGGYGYGRPAGQPAPPQEYPPSSFGAQAPNEGDRPPGESGSVG